MKKWILVLSAVLLVWNTCLTISLVDRKQTTEDGTTVVQNVIDSYTTDITETVDELKSSLVAVCAGDNEQSGIIYSNEDGIVYVVTAALYSSEEDTQYTVRFDSGAVCEAEKVGMDEQTGISLLTMKPDFETQAVTLGDSDYVQRGEAVIASGARRRTGQGAVSVGVSGETGSFRANSSAVWYCGMLETDTIVTTANIGGILVNLAGEMVGLLTDTPISGYGRFGYAIAVNEVKQIVRQLKQDGTVTRGTPGIVYRSVSDMESYEKNETGLSLDQKTGVLVTAVIEDGPSAGIIEDNDLITAFDGQQINNSAALLGLLYKHAPGDEVEIELTRNSEKQTVTVVLR